MATAIHSRALTKLVFDFKKREITYSQIINCCIASFRQQMLMRVLGEGVLPNSLHVVDDCRIQGPLLLPPIFFLIILLIVFFFSLPSGTSWGGHERRGIPLWYAIWLLRWAFRSWGEETRAILLPLLSVCYQPNAKVQKLQKIQKRTPDIPLFTVPLASERNSNIGQL